MNLQKTHMIKGYFVVLLLLCQFTLSAQWTALNSGTNTSLYGIQFLNKDVGYAVGDQGLIIKTTNAGQTWTNMNSGVNTWFFALSFVDTEIGYAAGASGSILKTTDGGANWTSLPTGATGFIDVWFLNKDTGFASGDGETFIKTMDGGNNWTLINNTHMPANEDIFFINKDTGFVAGHGISKSTDGGNTWVSVYSNDFIYSIQFVNSRVGFASTSDGKILKTTDGGNNWAVYSSPYSTHLRAIHFLDESTGYVCGGHFTQGSSELLSKTTDSAKTWSAETFPNGTGFIKFLNAIHFVDANTGFAAGMDGRILKYGQVSTVCKTKNPGNATTVYPNPFKAGTQITIDDLPIGQWDSVQFRSLDGRLILTKRAVPETLGTHSISINTIGVQKGGYLLQIWGATTGPITKRVLVF